MKPIDTEKKWVNKKGEAVEILSVDEDNELVHFKWLNNPKRKVSRVVSVDKFLAVLAPEGEEPLPTNDKPASTKSEPKIWIDELPAPMGKSSILVLADQEWLERGMHAKTVKFDIGQGGMAPEVNWEDRCAAIASIDNRAAKALASMILWGNDGAWNWSEAFSEVIYELAANMVGRCKDDGRSDPKACKHSLPELARLMARMTIYFELYQLWDVYTVKGRLLFSGIEVNSSTYTNSWLTYQRWIMSDLEELVHKANLSIGHYRNQLNHDEQSA